MSNYPYCDLPHPEFDTPELRAVLDAVSFLPAEMREDIASQYADALLTWLSYGWPMLTGGQMRRMSSAAPTIKQAFMLYTEATLDFWEIQYYKWDV